MGVDSRLGLTDTLPFGKYKGRTIEDIYKVNAGYLMWLRDAKAEPEPQENGVTQPPNREFFDVEVLTLLNATIANDPKAYPKHRVWDDVGKLPEPDDEPSAPALKPADLYNQWGAF
jgi:hypothetical protein